MYIYTGFARYEFTEVAGYAIPIIKKLFPHTYGYGV